MGNSLQELKRLEDIKYFRLLWFDKRIKELKAKIMRYKIKHGLLLAMILLSGCATDKTLHIIGSFGLTKASYVYYAKNTECNEDQARLAAFITALGIGFIKEMIDKKFDWKDIGADFIGAGIGGLSQ